MKADVFYQRIVKIAMHPPYDRYGLLAEFHTEIAIRYLNAVRTIEKREALRPGFDGRTVAQVVGHIAEWERFTISAAVEIILGLRRPRIMDLSGYLETDGQVMDFANEDDFNAYQAAKHARWSWQQIQELAIHTATALHALFTQPALMSPDTLERTTNYEWRLPNRIRLTIPAGWYLWMISLEHEAVEHAADLGWE